jgi:hypothetical protein
MGGACNWHGKIRNAYKFLLGKPEGKRQLGRPRRRWEDILETILKEMRWEVLDCFLTDSRQGPVAGPSEHINENWSIKDG